MHICLLIYLRSASYTQGHSEKVHKLNKLRLTHKYLFWWISDLSSSCSKILKLLQTQKSPKEQHEIGQSRLEEWLLKLTICRLTWPLLLSPFWLWSLIVDKISIFMNLTDTIWDKYQGWIQADTQEGAGQCHVQSFRPCPQTWYHAP